MQGTKVLGIVNYTYNGKGAVTGITRYDGNNNQLSSETNTYYSDEDYNETVWLETHTDVRGNTTKYVRNDQDNLWRVDAVQIWDTTLQTPAWRTIKSYTYYTGDSINDPGGIAGQVKTETVPDIDGTTAQITSYYYWETVNSEVKKRTSPTQTTYQYWNGSAYENKTTTTSYDDMGRVLSTTDANGKTIEYTYDAQGRQLETIYSTNVYTENQYSCCTLDWSKDENGNYTYYEYDDANRVIGTWTGLQGDSTSTNRLVSYAYDSFGNQQTVTTYSDASTPRVTTYTYDLNNRVTKIVYPYNAIEEDLIGNEEFIYDAKGQLVLKKDGNDKLTAYEYDDHDRLVGVDYEYTGSFALTTTWPDTTYFSADVTYEYDGDSSLRTSMTDNSGTSAYTYDGQARLKTYTPSVGLDSGYHVAYGYNNLGQKTSMKITNTTGTNTPYNVSYDYYANGWLKDVKSGATTIATYGYDTVGNRLTSAAPPAPVPDQPAGGDYGYDLVGNRLNPPTGTNHMVYNKATSLPVGRGCIITYTTAGAT